MREETPADGTSDEDEVAATEQPGQFPQTRWTLVLQASDGDEPVRQRALSELCEMYWYPLYAFVRHRGAGADEAMDLTQGFFEHLLSDGRMAKLRNASGRLRTYLLGAVKNFVSSEFTRRGAWKRGGGFQFIDIDQDLAESLYREHLSDQDSPEKLYDRSWAAALLNKAFDRVQREYEDSGRGQIFELLQGGIAVGSEKPSMLEAASELGIKEGAVRVKLHRLRKRYRAALEAEIAETVDGEEAVTEEIGYLLSVF